MEKRLAVAAGGLTLATAVVAFGTEFLQSPWSTRLAAVDTDPTVETGASELSEALGSGEGPKSNVEIHDVGVGDTILACGDAMHHVVAVQRTLDLVILRGTESGIEIEIGKDPVSTGKGCTLQVERLHTPLHANAPRAQLILTKG